MAKTFWGGVLVSLSIFSISLILPGFSSDIPVSAEQIEGSIYNLSASIDGNINITVPQTGTITTGSHNVIVSTTCPAGYTLSIETDNDGKIYRNADTSSEHYLSSVSGTLESPAELENNQWGFSLTDPSTNSNKFSAVPITKTDIKESNSGVAINNEETTIYYGIKADNTLPSGNYNGTIIYTTTPNPACFAYTVHFDSGIGTPTYPSKNLTYSESIDLSTYAPTKDGYVFAGWSDGTKTYKGTVSATDLNPSNQAEITLTAQYFQIKKWDFDYTGSAQTFTVPEDGTYRIELWGAQGWRYRLPYDGGGGGYTSGESYFVANKKIYLYIGEMRRGNADNEHQTTTAYAYGSYTFNGGSSGNYTCYTYYGDGRAINVYGGGATDIRIVGGSWNDFDSLKSRIMVAAAGSAGNHGEAGAAGGGLNGYSGGSGTGATQTAPGGPNKGGFGYAGTPAYSGGLCNNSEKEGAGSGYYGGGASNVSAMSQPLTAAGGGSSFISGHNGCNAIAENSTASNIIHTGQPNHYSGYKFTNTKMIDGAGYVWTNVKGTQEQMPNPAGGYYALGTGHTGNGYARITLIGK